MFIENGEFALFFRPHRGEFVIQGKKNVDVRGFARGGGGVGYMGAAGIDWYIYIENGCRIIKGILVKLFFERL